MAGNSILDTLLSSELLVGVSTFVLGYLAHLRGVNESRIKTLSNREEKKMHLYEVELEHLTERQMNLQKSMEKAIERLERERQELYARIQSLELKIDKVEREAYDWQTKYLECLRG